MNLADEVQINQNCGFWPVSNTIPIGGFASDPGTCLTFYTGASTPIFTGTFHGRDHWIMNSRIENEELVAFGLFRKTSSNSVIKNINFSDLEVRGKSNMGGVVGNLNSSSLENIYVYSLDVKGGENGADCKTGGLVGSAGGPSIINNVHIEDGNVSCKASGLGGILGVGGAHIDTASFSGQIESDTYNPTPINGVGGIAGRLATNGSITKAKSEGLIDSSAVQLGGILGSGDNSISLKHIYSTMVISSHNWISDNTTPLNIGGLVGFNDLVNFKYGYFAGFIYDSCNHPTQSNCKIGTIYGGLGGSGATPVNASAVAGTLNKGGFDDGTPLNYDTGLRSTTGFSSELTAYNSDVANGCNIIPCWSQIEGDIPRLNFEDHDCEDPTYQANINTQQVTYGRGNTESNPIIICNASQLKEIGNLVQRFSKHYMVKDNILMGDMTNERIGNSTDMFTGSFNGNEKYLYAGFMIIANTTNTSAKGLFNYLGPNGKLINVKITGLDITDANPGSKVGGLVGETANGSYIAYSSIRSGKISADTDVGAFVGIHNGVMEFSGGGLEVRGKTRVGGLIGTIGPTGVLRDSISHSRVSPNQDAYSTFGGVVGNNGGLIKRVQSRAEQYLVEKIPTTGAIVGGIAGQNTGTIEDISTEQDKIELNFVNGTTSYIVDPIVATNTGTIRRVISTTEVKLPQDYIGSCSTPATNCSGVGCHSQQTCSIDGGAWFPQTDLTIYTGIDMAPGGTVIDSYHAIDPHMAFHGTSVSGCTGTGTITVSMSTASPPSFTGTGDIYVEINNWEKVYPVNSITGTETQLLITASDCTDFPVGANIQLVKFVTGSTPSSTDMATLGNIETYCSSAVGAADNPYFTCSNSGDWDIVTDIDHTRDLGKQRLLDKYMSMMNGTINFNEGPFWSIEQGKPPRLISFD
ncbi:MAG: hypothetical protein EP319_00215 [Deltaproteobacteria bacterium]|nr:MAG: hypothetical protein EP319_00215 [Deltaproteobacteria bacterium]